jgi:hypothetical protein
MAGYASLIVFFIPGSTKNRWNDKQPQQEQEEQLKQQENDVLSEQQQQQEQQQQYLTTQEILRSGATSLTSSTNGGVDEVPQGHSYNAIVTILDPIDDSGKLQEQQYEYGQVVSFTNKGDNKSRVSRKSDDTGHEG